MEFEKRMHEHEIIVRESRVSLIIAMALLVSVAIYAGIARFVHVRPVLPFPTVYTLWQVFNIIAVVVSILVLAVRRTIYFSPRLIPEGATLTDLLLRWRAIDIVLMSLAEAVAILGLIVTLLGMPFGRTFHFFVAGFLLILILMPIPWKVRDKLNNFETHAGTRPH